MQQRALSFSPSDTPTCKDGGKLSHLGLVEDSWEGEPKVSMPLVHDHLPYCIINSCFSKYDAERLRRASAMPAGKAAAQGNRQHAAGPDGFQHSVP